MLEQEAVLINIIQFSTILIEWITDFDFTSIGFTDYLLDRRLDI